MNLTFDVDRPGVEDVILAEYLANNRVYVGRGAFLGFPTSIQDAIDRTSGEIVYADFPSSVADQGTWILRTITVLPPSADFDGNGNVDGDDFLAWQVGFGTNANARREDGEADGDRDVDGDDFLVWQVQFGDTPGGSAGNLGIVPEPTTAALFLLAAASMAAGRSSATNRRR